jgi:hypothetical protein
MIVGKNFIITNSSCLNLRSTWLYSVALAPFFSGIVIIVFKNIIPKLDRVVFSTRMQARILFFFESKFLFIYLWAIIFIAWLPILFATFPGINAYDSAAEYSYFSTGNITTHQPIIHTYLLEFFIQFVGKIINNEAIGLLLYSILQMLILSSALAYIIFFLNKRKISSPVKLGLLILFMFLPINPIMAISSTKDVIFAATVVFSQILFFIFAEKSSKGLSVSFIFIYIIVIFLNLAFRSQSIYVYIFTIFIGMLVLSGKRKELLVLLLIPVSLYFIYIGPVSNGLHVTKFDSIHEMMSVPCMQLARTLESNNNSLTKIEKKEIKEYIPDYQAVNVTPAISDSIKNTFNTKKFKNDPIKFASLWMKIGIKNKLNFIDAFGRLTIGLWYPDMNYPDKGAYHPYWEYIQSKADKNYPKSKIINESPIYGFNWLHARLERFTYKATFNRVPVVSMLFSSGFYSWLLILTVGWMVYQKKYRFLFPLAYLVGLWLTLLLGPVVLYRYIFPIGVALPIYLACRKSMPDGM